MQAAGVDVAAVRVAELAAGVQRGEDQFQAGFLCLGCMSTGMPRPLSVTVTRVAGLVQRDGDGVGVAVEVLVDGVVDDFPDEVVQPLGVDAADVHGRPLADRLQPFEDLDVFGAVLRGCATESGAHVDLSRSSSSMRSTQCLVDASMLDPAVKAATARDHQPLPVRASPFAVLRLRPCPRPRPSSTSSIGGGTTRDELGPLARLRRPCRRGRRS